jgi:hypothetical protein
MQLASQTTFKPCPKIDNEKGMAVISPRDFIVFVPELYVGHAACERPAHLCLSLFTLCAAVRSPADRPARKPASPETSGFQMIKQKLYRACLPVRSKRAHVTSFQAHRRLVCLLPSAINHEHNVSAAHIRRIFEEICCGARA